MTNNTNSERVLGDLRIFQAVYADLRGTLNHSPDITAYIYTLDPFEFEDNKFPITVAAIEAHTRKAQLDLLDRLEKEVVEATNCWSDGSSFIHTYKTHKVIPAQALSKLRKELTQNNGGKK